MAASNAGPSALEKEQIFGMAEKEMEYRVELFNKLTSTCFNKCVEKKYKESELNMGENSCIDRCVSKYWQNISRASLTCTRVQTSISPRLGKQSSWSVAWYWPATNVKFVSGFSPSPWISTCRLGPVERARESWPHPFHVSPSLG
ncbi:mitochondrial import inner membrane translocase subunit TIM10 isoform X1 [Punica granatum]|uniref:Mitochondrial import inner membrane translocase subunit n=1 Tax=Punica granatum TaxID=22663 RepID=A0A6P8D0F2_PUNGR|nr:mitochondrial import inner membrane translocase subunit TIM10 isoform X1 [Punica granatum]